MAIIQENLPSVLVAFSALLWLGSRKGIQPVKNMGRMVEVGTGYSGLSGAHLDG